MLSSKKETRKAPNSSKCTQSGFHNRNVHETLKQPSKKYDKSNDNTPRSAESRHRGLEHDHAAAMALHKWAMWAMPTMDEMDSD
eukprot:3181731-Amphidinium_carterae.1